MNTNAMDKIQVLTTIISLFNEREFDDLKEYIDAKAVVKLPNGKVLSGIDQIIATWRSFSTTFPDIHYDIKEVSGQGNPWSVSVEVSGTFDNSLLLPNGEEIMPTGKSFRMDQEILMEINRSGRLFFEEKKYDLSEFYDQLGVQFQSLAK